jgi:hypothetical protein
MPECARCDRHYSVDVGDEPSKYCNYCAHERVEELEALINTPQVEAFLKAVELEAAHQVERWGTAHDDGKTDADWFWLLGWLAGKAVHATDPQKKLHHVITTAAAAMNWHRHLTGENTRMRPGIAAPEKEPLP